MKTPNHVLLSMILSFAGFLVSGPAPAASVSSRSAKAPFEPTMDSLTNYHCPEWFRDAKFGIWAHWGPQAVPMFGDWYARHLYVQNHAQYKDHLEHFGHPSTNGYKDIIPLWKAEKWDPDRLMQLYKKAGAKYFVSMGSHHDNFYLWNSKLHKWNSVQMGPRRDVVGEWQRAARKQGLRFGVSEHLGASFTWFQDSHKSDKTGPMAGVPYDGADPRYQDLYHFPAEPGDTGWYSTNPRWQRQWFERIQELVDDYSPDLLYTDGGVPFGNEVGRGLIAHFYNASAAKHRGKPTVIYTCKQKSEGRWVEDLERGVMPGINPFPWQTDTSIGDWFYNRNWKFRPVSWTIHMLVDIVSKNGNLLLNVVQRPDGSLDPEVESALAELAEWTKIHGEGIYGSRPWLVYGEGAVRAKGGHFKEDFAYTAKDIRFTTKGDKLYAFALGWPDDGRLLIRSLAQEAGKIRKVSLLGYRGKLTWMQTPEGLAVSLPARKISKYTAVLKIEGKLLKPAPIASETVRGISSEPDGSFSLSAETAELHGEGINTEERNGHSNIGYWDNAQSWASWKVIVAKPGTYQVIVDAGTVHPDIQAAVEIAGQRVIGSIPQTGDWGKFSESNLGTIQISQAGEQVLHLRPADLAKWKAINVRSVKLKPAS